MSDLTPQRSSHRLTPIADLPRIVAAVLSLVLAGCAGIGSGPASLGVVEPLQLEDRVLTVDDVDLAPAAPDLLALDDDMIRFVDTYAGARGSR